jgi:hypothetical protein
VGAALKVFRVTSAYSGKSDVVRPSALLAALAKHLHAHGLEAQVPRYSVMPSAGGGFLDRALNLQNRVHELSASGTASPDIDSAAQVLDQLLQSMFSGGGDGMRSDPGTQMLQQLGEADMIADAVGRGFGLLTVELAATGGSYRAKKWILNALFGRDGLSYSGGAAATYFLMAGDKMAALSSDTIYFTSGFGTFQRPQTDFSASNIPAFDTNS